MTQYRPAIASDQPHIQDLDLKCHEQPQSLDWWKMMGENPQAHTVVECHHQIPIGFMVWEQESILLPDSDEKQPAITLHKICVRKEYRRRGIAMDMLAHAHEEAIKQRCKYIVIAVPEYRCKRGDPDDVSEWLLKLNFKAHMTLPEKIHLYGKEYDQYLFVFEV